MPLGTKPAGPDGLSTVTQRLPQGLGSAIAEAVERGVIVVVGGHRFTLAGLGATKGPYAFFSRSDRKVPAPNNPWGAGATTLEWTLSSPPPFHQFEVLPRIQ